MFGTSQGAAQLAVEREPEEEQREVAPDPRDAKRERRRTIRHKCRVNVAMLMKVRYGGTDEWSVHVVALKGRLLDLSAEGALLCTKENLEFGQELRLVISMPGEPIVKAHALVGACKPIPNKGAFASGVNFTSLSAQGSRSVERFLLTIQSRS